MLTKTFTVFFAAQLLSSILATILKQHDWFTGSIIVQFVPICILAIFWPLYLRTSSYEIQNLAYFMKDSLIAIAGMVMAGLLGYISWYFFIKSGPLQELWGKDFEVFRVLLSISLILSMVLYYLVLFFKIFFLKKSAS